MLSKIKAYFIDNPNGTLYSAVVFAFTTMNTAELIQLLSALAMLLSAVSGVVRDQLKARAERQAAAQDMELEKAEKMLELEMRKVEIEAARLQMTNKFINFESSDNAKIQNLDNEQQH